MMHAFVSYVRQNREVVEELCAGLNARGIPTWTDIDQLQPGQNWRTAIRRAIRSGNAFIACFSQESNERVRSYMNLEITLAIDELRQYPFERAWFMPVMLSQCEIPDLDIGGGAILSDIQAVKLYDDWDSGVDSLARAISSVPTDAESEQQLTFSTAAKPWQETWEALYNLKMAGDELLIDVTDATLREYTVTLRRAGSVICKNAPYFEPEDFDTLDNMMLRSMDYRCGKFGLLGLQDDEVRKSRQRWDTEVIDQMRENRETWASYSALIRTLHSRYSTQVKRESKTG